LVFSNHNSFGVLFDEIASVYYIWKIYLHFSIGNGQPMEPALCQLNRRTFVPYVQVWRSSWRMRNSRSVWPSADLYIHRDVLPVDISTSLLVPAPFNEFCSFFRLKTSTQNTDQHQHSQIDILVARYCSCRWSTSLPPVGLQKSLCFDSNCCLFCRIELSVVWGKSFFHRNDKSTRLAAQISIHNNDCPTQVLSFDSLTDNNIPYHTIPYHTIPYHIRLCQEGGFYCPDSASSLYYKGSASLNGTIKLSVCA